MDSDSAERGRKVISRKSTECSTRTDSPCENSVEVRPFRYTILIARPDLFPNEVRPLTKIIAYKQSAPGQLALQSALVKYLVLQDSVPVLKEFADNLGITGRQWLFLTGDRDKIYDIAQNSYMVTAQADSTAPGGVVHSGAFILVDKAKHIRGIYDGTTEAGVDKLMGDIDRLLAESNS